MRSLFSSVIMLGLRGVANAQTFARKSLIDAVEVVTNVDLTPEQAGSASVLLIKQVEEERHSPGCKAVVLLQENGRPNHLVLIESWRTAGDLNMLRKSGSYKRFRSELQPNLASPLDERMEHQIAP